LPICRKSISKTNQEYALNKLIRRARQFTTVVVLALLEQGVSGCGSAEDGQSVPRSRTFITDCVDFGTCDGQFKDYDNFHPYQAGANTRTGFNFLYEPLYFYNAYVDSNSIMPWIGTGHEFNDDFTEITVHIREGVEWSDGHPWTAADLVFTINMLRENAPFLLNAVDMKTWVEKAEVIDPLTAKITLTAPNPRFMFSYFTNNFDNGVPIIPKHIWEGKDAQTFKNLDMAQGWPVVSGPYRLEVSSPEQRIWRVRTDWWAEKIGFQQRPQVERLIYVPFMDEAKRVQAIISNTLDMTAGVMPANVMTMVDENPNVTTWSGRDVPYGYLDWWPLSLGFNAMEPPFDDAEVRWAINHAINREQLVEVGWMGAGKPSLLPFPDFPSIRKYLDQVQDVIDKYPVGVHDPQRTAEILSRKGWAKDEDGIWAKDGDRFKIVIDISPGFQDITPVLVRQLLDAGFDASSRMTSDGYSRTTQGIARTYIMGNGGSVRDPYFTMRLYHDRFALPTGEATDIFWRWRHRKFSDLVDEMGQTSPEDPRMIPLLREALDIWLAEMPAIPLLQFYHRLPHNQTNWTNWPSQENPYINSAYWHRTWLLVLLNLKPVH
jgi:peptide/nickel transport system substrate-binding protein